MSKGPLAGEKAWGQGCASSTRSSTKDSRPPRAGQVIPAARSSIYGAMVKRSILLEPIQKVFITCPRISWRGAGRSRADAG